MSVESDGSLITTSSGETDEEFTGRNSAPHFPNQEELDDLIRDLGLTKSGAELLTSRLQEWHLLDKDCRSTVYRSRHVEFSI